MRATQLLLVCVFSGNSPAQVPIGQVLEDFDDVQPSWQIWASDSLLNVAVQRRSDRDPLSGRRCEYLSLLGVRGGEQILAAHEIPAFAVIDEFRANLWVRGNRAGYQLMVRARLPRALDDDGCPISVLLLGDQYSSPGQWQRLSIDHISSKLADQTRVLRLSHGRDVNPANAYVDRIVLNVYGGAGLNRVWIDDLSVEAAVAWSGIRRDARVRQATHDITLPRVDDFPQDRPAPAESQSLGVRAVTHHGESFETLKDLGFNTIWLDQSPTREQLADARSQHLWLLSDPPRHDNDYAECDRVIAWCIGKHRQTRDEEATRRLANSVRALDPYKRPLLVTLRDVDDAWQEFADISIDTGTSRSAVDDGRARWMLLGGPLAASSRWMPLRDEMYSAVAHGYQDFILQTGQSLETPGSQHARHLAQLFNLELRRLRPWLGQMQQRLASTSPFDVTLLAGEHSTLAIVTRAKTAPAEIMPLPVVIEIPDASNREVFLVEPGGLSQVRYRRVPGGVRVSLDPSTRQISLLLTDRPSIIREFTRFLREVGPRANNLLAETAREELLTLDRRIEHSTESQTTKSQLRQELHALNGGVAGWMEPPEGQPVTYRQLEAVLWGLESLHSRIRK